MKVFIENEAGSNQKNLYNEKTLEYKKTVTVSREYPYPYGFILDTTSGDGDNLDCFVITDSKLEVGKVYECEPIGLMEQVESSWSPEKGEQVEVTEDVKNKLTNFVSHVSDHIEGKVVNVGAFLGKDAAEQEIIEAQD